MKKYALILLILLSGFLYADTIHVPKDFASIADAVKAAASGDTIEIAAGSFNEKLVINKELTLIGSGTSKTMIFFSNKGTSGSSPLKSNPVIKIQTDAVVRIENLSIGGDALKSSKAAKTDYGIASSGCDLTLNNVNINNIRIAAIWCEKGTVSFDYLTISNKDAVKMEESIVLEDVSSVSISNSKLKTYLASGLFSKSDSNEIILENLIFISENAAADIYSSGSSIIQAVGLLIDGKNTVAAIHLAAGPHSLYLQSSNLINNKTAVIVENNLEETPPPVKIVVENTRINDLTENAVSILGSGRVEIDLGDGMHESLGGNIYNASVPPVIAFSPDHDIEIYAPISISIVDSSGIEIVENGEVDEIAELYLNDDSEELISDDGESIDIAAADDITDIDAIDDIDDIATSEVEAITDNREPVISAATEPGARIVSVVNAERSARFVPENQVRTNIEDFSVVVSLPGGTVNEINLQPLYPERAAATEKSTWIVYRNHRDELYLGYYENQNFKKEFSLKGLEVHDIAVDDIKAAVYYSSDNGNYVGLFSRDMLFTGEFRFHEDIEIIDIHIRGREVWVHYKYPLHGEYMGRFDTSMRFIGQQKLYK